MHFDQGGAIELSWTIYCARGTAPHPDTPDVSCDGRRPELAAVRLSVEGVDDGSGVAVCPGRDGCEFGASRSSGVTGFFIPPADYAIAIIPVDGIRCRPRGAGLRHRRRHRRVLADPRADPAHRRPRRGGVARSLVILVPDCPVLPGYPPDPEAARRQPRMLVRPP